MGRSGARKLEYYHRGGNVAFGGHPPRDCQREGIPPVHGWAEVKPNFELWFPKNEYDRRALEEPLVARIDGHEVNVGPLEQQIAYKLFLGTEKDFEDALHLYTVFREQLDTDTLETYVEELEVSDRYAELRGT